MIRGEFFGIPSKYFVIGVFIITILGFIGSFYLANKAIDKGVPIVVGPGYYGTTADRGDF
jgi:hypothetical protein